MLAERGKRKVEEGCKIKIKMKMKIKIKMKMKGV